MIPPIKMSDKMRLKAFRVPLSYLQDCLLGYQGNAEEFCIYRMRPDLLPEGFKIKFVAYEHPRNCFYFQVEHSSFPEVSSTEPLDAISLEIEEIRVKTFPSNDVVNVVEGSENQSLRMPPSDVERISRSAIHRNKNIALNLGAKMLLARSRHKGVNI